MFWRTAPVFVLALLAGLCWVAPGEAQVPPPAPAKLEPEIDTLRIPYYSNQQPTLDPHACQDPLSFRMIATVYETLYMYVPGDDQRVEPCLAADWPEVSEDGLTVTIKLRKDVPFHNSTCFGEERTRNLKAADVVDSFKRLSVFSDEGMYWMADGLIAGLDEYGRQARFNLSYGTTDTEVEGLKAIDGLTVQLKLNRPYGPLPTLLAHPCFSVMPGEAMDMWTARLGVRAVGTGPYRLNAVAGQKVYALKRVDGFRDGESAFKRVIFAEQGYWNDFLYGFRDGKFHETPVWPAFWDRIVANDELTGELEGAGGEAQRVDEHGYYFLCFNMEDELWGALDDDGRGLRRAVALCLDREKILEAAGWDPEWASPQEALYPVGMEFADTGEGLGYGRHDIELAKKTLDGTKYKGGKNPDTGEALTLKLLISAAELYEGVAEALREGLGELGIKLNVRYVSGESLRDDARTSDEQLFIAGWFLDYPDPQNFLQLFWSERAKIDKEFNNVARYRSDAFDKLFLELETLQPAEPDHERRRELVAAMAKELAKDQPTIPLVRSKEGRIRSTKVDWAQMPRQTFNDLRFVEKAGK